MLIQSSTATHDRRQQGTDSKALSSSDNNGGGDKKCLLSIYEWRHHPWKSLPSIDDATIGGR